MWKWGTYFGILQGFVELGENGTMVSFGRDVLWVGVRGDL